METPILKHQYDFPEVDLTEENAAFLENFLQNYSLVEASHLDTKQSHLLYNMAHIAAKQSQGVFNNDNYHAEFAHGFTTYEIITSLVTPRPAYTKAPSVIAASRNLADALDGQNLREFLTDTYDEFNTQQPTTVEVVTHATDRYRHGLARHAILGAAVKRQLELDTREYENNLIERCLVL
ncbi:MAG TPA: hypothetical protein VFM68_00560 [Candidatus Saccharimonadales bacterium]|nr:hypothetical protein [Candidatus Saccharimonadales bacterium]